MKFEITIFEENKDEVYVKNNGVDDFVRNGVYIEAGAEKAIPVHLAKFYLGDWTKENNLGEQRRRKKTRIDLLDVKIITKKGQKTIKEVKGEEVIEKKKKEPEFGDLKRLTKEKEEEKIDDTCKGEKADGTPCKNEVKDGEEFCHWHKPKKKKK